MKHPTNPTVPLALLLTGAIGLSACSASAVGEPASMSPSPVASARALGGTAAGQVPADRVYTRDHVWIRRDADGTVVLGVTNAFVTEAGGDLYSFFLPRPGARIALGASFAEFEAAKAAAELLSPVMGTVVAVNEDAQADPGVVSYDPFDAGWLVRLKPTGPLPADAMDASAYEQYLSTYFD